MATDLQQDYAGAGFGQTVGFGDRPALILIDFVQAYFVETSLLYARDGVPKMKAALEAALRIREAAHRAGMPVFLTKVELNRQQLENNLLFYKTKGMAVFEEGNPLAGFADGLVATPKDIVVNKYHSSSFHGTPLPAMLAWRRVDNLIITGISTSGCVRATCSDSVAHGFRPSVVYDAVGDRDERPHEANLFDMGQKMADLVSADEVIEYISGLHRFD